MILRKHAEQARKLSLCSELMTAPPAFGPIGKDIVGRSYSRRKSNDKSESWAETAYRVAYGNCDFVDEKYIQKGEREALLQAIFSMAMIPAGRHIRNTGIKDREFVHNCHTSGWVYDNPFETFGFTMKALMQGGGVGCDYSCYYSEKMPKIKYLPNIKIICREDHKDWEPKYPVDDDGNIIPGSKPWMLGVGHYAENCADGQSYEHCLVKYDTKNSFSHMIANPETISDSTESSKDRSRIRHEGHADSNSSIDSFIQKTAQAKISSKDYIYVKIEDNRQGWVDALNKIFNFAWGNSGFNQKSLLVLDVSDIREYGATLKSFGGKASGPVPLIEMLIDIISVFEKALRKTDFCPVILNPIEFMEIDHAIAVCVCSGGSRRSARMSMLHWKDRYIWEFIDCKQTDKKKDKPHWTTNISIIIDDEFIERLNSEDPYVKEFHLEVCKRQINRGEPAYWNKSNANKGEIEDLFATNPCGEQGLNMFDACDLGHFNMLMFALYPESAEPILRLLTRFLIRATYADMTSEIQEKVVRKNRRIGVGFLGFADYVAMQGIKYSECWKDEQLKNTLNRWYEIVYDEASKYSFELRIPMPVKVTTVAPTGSICYLPGVTPGCQPIKFKYFHRRVRYSKSDQLIAKKKEEGHFVEDCYYAKNTSVVSYWMQDSLLKRVEESGMDVSLIEEDSEVGIRNMLEVQAMVQENWADNSVSFTVNLPERIILNENGDPVKDEDPNDPDTIGRLKTECTLSPEELAEILKDFMPRLKGTTVVREGSYLQMPYERCSKEKFLEKSGDKNDIIGNAEIRCPSGVCDI